MSKQMFRVVTVLLLSVLSAGAQQMPPELMRDGQLDLDAAVDWFEDLYRADSSEAVATLTVTKPRRTRTMEMKTWSEGEDKSLVVIQAPPRDKGTATLKVDDSLWNYLPKIQRTIRIPASMMQASWMGSDFTNDDLVRESSFREDYTYELAGRVEGPTPAWQISFTAKEGVAGLWERFELVLSEDGLLPVSAKYYDRRGRLARTIAWSDVREFDGRRIPTRMLLVPADKEGCSTEFVYESIRFNVDLPGSLFSLSSLERHR